MKKLFIISACLFGLFACQRMEEVPELKVVEFEASNVATDATRASYDSQKHALAWEYGDQVGCFADMSKNVKFTNSESSPNTFSGTVWAEPKEYYFYFPYSAAATAEGTVVTSTYPSAQELKVGTFGAAPVMVAKSSDLDNGVDFHNACGLVRFTVKSDIAKKLIKAEFYGNDNELIAGKYTMDMASATPSLSIAEGGESLITMTGEVEMAANTAYSFILALPPTDFTNGITLKLWDDQGRYMTKTFDKELNLGRNKAMNISEVIEFTEANSEPVIDIQISAFSLTSVSDETVNIDDESNTIIVTRTGFINPQSVTVSMTVNAGSKTRADEPVTVTLEPTTTIVAGGTIHPDNTGVISNPSSFKMNMMMPRKIAITCGEFSETYTVKFSQLTDSGLPVVYINTATGKDVPVDAKDTWIEGSEIYIDADGRTTFDKKALTDLANIECEIKGRGNTTWDWVKATEDQYTNGAKRPYAIKLDKKKEVLGMAQHKRWVLLNNFCDKSMIRNFVAYRTANALADVGSQEWHPSGQLVEVVMNGLHRGCYLLCEQIKIAEGARIKGVEFDDKVHTGDVEGAISYLLEGDRNWGHVKTGDPSETLYWESYLVETSWKQSSNGTYIYGTNYINGNYNDGSGYYKFRWGLKSPDDGDLGSSVVGKGTKAYQFINKTVTDVEKYLFGGGFTENTSLADINQYINLDSFIEYWLVYEIATNQEPNNPGSCYMHYYNGDGKLYMGPVWDFDYGSFLTSAQFDDGLYADKDKHFQLANALWYCRLLQNKNVQEYVKQKWPTYRAAAAAVANEMAAMKTYLTKAAEYNFNLWPMSSSADPNSERNMAFSSAFDRINTNMANRLSQLDELINNKRYY